ncbi:MAG: hypothetical protein LBL07_12535 [Tannerella sp.]|jgi:hypothetical protein|nr:hypothetical protein [Tannerella sp.]
MKNYVIILLLLFYCVSAINGQGQQIRQDFENIPVRFRPNPLWFWNDTKVEKEELIKQMELSKDAGYGGLSILPFGKNFMPEYLSEDYFDVYRTCIEKAKKLGMTLWIYDEYGFPSGTAGDINGDGIGRFKQKYPEHTYKRLDKTEFLPEQNNTFGQTLPDGLLMAAVAMDTVSLKRIDLQPFIAGNRLTWNVPEGHWKILVFTCVDAGNTIVDYMSPEAVSLFIEMTHEQYYKHFKDYFGSTIIGTFFDEPTLYYAEGRSWTPDFNKKFEKKYGISPALYYPALWYDIGEDTEEARNYLFGFRSELYAEGFTRQVNDWSVKHGVLATGHQDNEEIINSVGTAGDLMKCFKYLEAPGIDKIGGNRPAERFYKIVSSAAYNWDHSRVMSETYGAMGNISWTEIFNIAIDQYSKGINILIPHATWYNTEKVVFLPELSLRNPVYADSLRLFTDFLTRLNAVMQNDARWSGDIAVLYPINTMQSGHYMDGPLGHYRGGVEIPGLDYINVGVNLFDSLGYDFMFLHPEVLDEQCILKENRLFLNNQTQYNAFSTLVIPGCRTISLSNLDKIKKFAAAGGAVIFTTALPEKATIQADNEKVKNIVDEMIRNKKAIFIENPSVQHLGNVMDKLSPACSFRFTGKDRVQNIHKILDGNEIWYLANPSPAAKHAEIELDGNYHPEVWDPHTGETGKTIKVDHKNGKTRFSLDLDGGKSVFVIADLSDSNDTVTK